VSAVTRSMEATATASAAAVAQQRRAQPSGWWGALLLVATEVTLFSCLIATYFYLRFKTSEWPLGGIEKPSVALPLALTALLLASAAPLAAAVRAAKLGRAGLAWWLVAAASTLQASYLGVQIALLVSDLGSFSPRDNAYGSIYFALIGVHHFHVAVGLAIDAWLLAKLARGLTNYRLIGLRVAALYWYFVAAVAVPVVLTQLYPSL
jgi:heme/copper-type cytochrome/quinol oxidase subunit 3